MPIEFVGSPKPTIGVEIALQSSIRKRETPKSIALLELYLARSIERVKAEMTQPMVEIDTEISNDVTEYRPCLKRWRW